MDFKLIEPEKMIGTENWTNFTVKIFDYLANNSIEKKNEMVAYRLEHILMPHLFNNENLFKEVIDKID